MEPKDTSEGIPKSLLEKHPKLARIEKAFQEYIRGEPITSLCTVCNQPLTVSYVEATDTYWVTCVNGCTFYHLVGKVK